MTDQQPRLDAQFQRQQATPLTINEVEKLLRDSRESFVEVRTQSPTRFRVVNQNGEDIRDTRKKWGDTAIAHSDTDDHSTRVDHSFHDQCSTAFDDPTHTHWPGVTEAAGCYRAEAAC